ncbi:enoyl-CoA hydratase/isomerase family protein [Croceiramulus getboli]|nr:enoyl-CoA hydratase/isomerase family protein [Flavobacteriaceae bacterium YJPT1-3]
MSASNVGTEIEGRIATITFSTPQHNALPSKELQALETSFRAVSKREDIYLIIFKSGGDRTFCAGASFEELMKISNEQEGKAFFLGFARVIQAMRDCRQPILARVQGKAVGGGVGLAAAADYCLATRFSSIKLSEISIGIGPFVIGPAVQRKMGIAAFSQLTLAAHQFFEAEWALHHGLFQAVYDDQQELDKAVQDLAERLITYNPEALRLTKQMFYEGEPDWKPIMDARAALSGSLVLSSFTRERLQAFKS